jgi:hypothetical protein
MPVTVVRGDTLNKIAAANSISLSELLAVNPDIDNPDLIHPGDVIVLPSDAAETQDPAPAPDEASEPEAVDPALGILQGGETIRVEVDGQIRWYQIYEFPPGSKQFISYQFNSEEQAAAALGTGFEFTNQSDTWFNTNVVAEAEAEEVIGLTGSFAGLTNEIMIDAALAAGVNDPSLVGQIASDPEMQAIMAQAVVGNWTEEQIIAAQRDTDFWKNVLYPGIDKFYGQTTDPEKAWLDYRRDVSPILRQLGYEPDANGTFNSQVQQMLGLNVDSQTFISQAPTFILATQNEEFAAVLNQWAQRDLGREIGFNDWFDLIAGESIPELEQVAENARLAWIAQNRGTTISDIEIEALAARTELSDAEAAQAFAEVNQAMLALGARGLERGGLTRDDILSSSFGTTPESGRSLDEIKLAVAKLAREEDLFDEKKINFFVGFDPLGRPNRPGLISTAPEGA